ncbi:MAG TPA: hypothetical protein PK450_12895 [Paracoccaceae bacterium]|nr:hypothetical protein [Paracoccaceae bacterium]
MTDLPDYYFRVRENGAAVFRLNPETRLRRLDLEQIAVANLRNGEIRAQGDYKLSEADLTAIRDWMAERAEVLAARDMDDILRAMDHLNLTAQWAQTKATPEQLEAVTDRLLLAMHDLRQVLVRKKSERIGRPEAE